MPDAIPLRYALVPPNQVETTGAVQLLAGDILGKYGSAERPQPGLFGAYY